ncbi:ATP-dependent endonuclease [Parasaccharibacter sp. TMW2.1890]|uniref:ATP-dependent nuclease n=1 Tax=Parasaccharibacter sp. TMW2.1890 TaxID=2039289 RepID=UPI002012DE2C|nr:ATP-binding protein [Parasaccharibacter sp. TMW2.1890]MCL1515188.1 hypothetical protein [Parasaccharibacter sp. TMW2.1890]
MSNKDSLSKLMNGKSIEPFIRHIRFPKYRNLKEDTKIVFSYPITAIVGRNGTNKSSVLKALYGSPRGYSVGTYWFSTSIDPIPDGDDNPSCFIYGYKKDGKTIEVIYQRTRRDNDPNYWESHRPSPKYGLPTQEKRNPPIDKNVCYIDFRHSLSAFDKFFYSPPSDDISELKKRSLKIAKASKWLKEAMDSKKKSNLYYNVERILDRINMCLDEDSVKCISEILGCDYSEIHIIKHFYFADSDYSIKGFTVRLCREGLKYSEAFAGSGEFAVVFLVWRIMNTKDRSLILLDEPEVSLHPAAQKRMFRFLERQVLRRKHQVVLTTHSPEFIKYLPQKAIKLLTLDKDDRVHLHAQSNHCEEVFCDIGHDSGKIYKIFVEDKAAQLIVNICIKRYFSYFSEKIDVIPLGGADDILKHNLPRASISQEGNILFLLDGDQRRGEWPASGNVTDNDLEATVHNLLKGEPKFKCGKVAQDVKMNHLRNLLSYGREVVDYLPGNTPEEWILRELWASGEHSYFLADKEFPDALADPKATIDKIAKRIMTQAVTASNINTVIDMMITRIPHEWAGWNDIKSIINSFIKRYEEGM